MPSEEGSHRPLRRAKNYMWGLFGATLLAYTFSMFSATEQMRSAYSSLVQNYQEMTGVEQNLDAQAQLEQIAEISEMVETEDISDLLTPGADPKDTYQHDLGSESGRYGMQLSPGHHVAASKMLKWKMDEDGDGNSDDSQEHQGMNKYVRPDEDKLRDMSFDLIESDANKSLQYNEGSSFIIPYGEWAYDGADSEQQTDDNAADEGKDMKAIILMDTSGSMVYAGDDSKANFAPMTFYGTTEDVYLPTVLALNIADFVIDQFNAPVCGITFSSDSQASGFTRNINTLANTFSQLQGNGTFIDYEMVADLVDGTNSSIDIYVIADNDIFSEQGMRQTIDSFNQALGASNDLARMFFIEWRAGSSGYNANKRSIIQQTGQPNVFYSKISSLDEVQQMNADLRQQLLQE